MRIEPHANLTITLLQRHKAGADCLVGSVPRRVEPLPGAHPVDVASRCEPSDPAPPPLAACPDLDKPEPASGPVGIATPGEDSSASPAPETVPPNPAFGSADITIGTMLDVFA